MTSMSFISVNSYFLYSLNIIFSQTHCLVIYGKGEAPLLMLHFDKFFSLPYSALLEQNEPSFVIKMLLKCLNNSYFMIFQVNGYLRFLATVNLNFFSISPCYRRMIDIKQFNKYFLLIKKSYFSSYNNLKCYNFKRCKQSRSETVGVKQ